jgi:putative nucleotidyltransferase with HDIG domain
MSEAPPPPTLEAATAAVQRLPSLPGSTRQLLGYLNDESVDLKIIVRAIECDQGLAIGVLRLANSPFFGMANKVQTINDAVVVLGFSNLRMIIVSAMAAAIKFPDLGNDAVVHTLFRHGLAVAIGASILARNNALDPNPLFLAGILHDIGILALMSTYPALHAQARALAQRDQCLLFEAENAVFGFDHADIGASLCRHWNLPETIVQAIGRHHQREPLHSDATAWAAPDKAAGIVQLADAIAHTLNLEQDPQPRVPPVSKALWKRLGAEPQTLATSYGEIERLYQELVVLIAN